MSKKAKASSSKSVKLKDLKVCHPMPDMDAKVKAKGKKKSSTASKASKVRTHDKTEAVVETSKRWPNGKSLKVFFMPGHNKKVAAKCLEIMKEWEKYANLKFEQTKTQKEADIRVAFVKGGSYSYIGTDAKHIAQDQHTMNFGWLTEKSPEEEYQRVVLHETGHAIGLLHEHEHPENTIPWNESAVLKYYQNQGWTAAQTREQVLTKASKGKTQYSKWDRNSIMEYPIPKELVTDEGYSVGWNTALSKTDKEFIRTMYPGAAAVAESSRGGSSSSGKKDDDDDGSSSSSGKSTSGGGYSGGYGSDSDSGGYGSDS